MLPNLSRLLRFGCGYPCPQTLPCRLKQVVEVRVSPEGAIEYKVEERSESLFALMHVARVPASCLPQFHVIASTLLFDRPLGADTNLDHLP